MREYRVFIPVVSTVEVCFESEEELTNLQAFQHATDECDWHIDVIKDCSASDYFSIDLPEVKVVEEVVRGNVYYGTINAYRVDSEEVND